MADVRPLAVGAVQIGTAATARIAEGGPQIPVLWLCGPPGVGKSSVGWELHRQLVADGFASSYVDIDQLGMCYPEPAGDAGRWALKNRNLAAVLARFAEAGAELLVVSGVIDSTRRPDARELGALDLTVCRLRADHDVLAQRLADRRASRTEVDAALHEADVLDASTVTDACVDTSRLTLVDAVARVRDVAGAWTASPRSAVVPDAAAAATRPECAVDGGVLWLLGPTGVGKSTVGFAAYLEILGTGRAAAYLDADQIGCCSTAPDDHELRGRIVVDLWNSFRTAGADALVVVGPIADATALSVYTAALEGLPTTFCRLHASPSELTVRVLSRHHGGSWQQPGDPLRGQPEATLLAVAREAIACAGDLEAADLGVRIDTSALSVDDAAQAVLPRCAVAQEPVSRGSRYAYARAWRPNSSA